MIHAELIHTIDKRQIGPDARLCPSSKHVKQGVREQVRLTVNGQGTLLMCSCGYEEPSSTAIK